MRYHAYERVLGVYPSQTGFAFAVLERNRGLIDWGEAELGVGTDEEFLTRLSLQVEQCSPAVLAVENCLRSPRQEKARRRVEAALALARGIGLATVMLSAAEIRNALCLSIEAKKHDVVDRLCDRHPELARQRPTRLIWKKDPKMHVFDAVALAAAGIGAG